MIRVLVLARDTGWYGGVVNFIETLIKNYSNNIQCFHFRIGKRKCGIGIIFRYFMPLFDSIRLLLHLMSHKYDAVHINPSLNYSSILRDGLFMLVMRIMRVKNVIVVFHGWEKRVEERIARNRLLTWLFRTVFGYANHTLVLAEDFRQCLVSMGFEDSRVHLFTTMFDNDEFNAFGEPVVHDKNRILFLSRLVREKGVYELFEAFTRICHDYPDAKLVFAGNGPEENNLKRLVADADLNDQVIFTGYVRGSDKIRVLMQSGLFVFPTYYGEGCPVSLLEAMAAALPVITTTAGGIPHIVQHRINGILMDNVTPETVESAIRDLLSDEALSKEMSNNNRKKAWANYSAPVVTHLFESIYSGEF